MVKQARSFDRIDRRLRFNAVDVVMSSGRWQTLDLAEERERLKALLKGPLKLQDGMLTCLDLVFVAGQGLG